MSSTDELRNQIFAYAEETYGTQPEYLWPRFPDCAVLRRGDNRKWYGIVMDVSREKLGLPGLGRVDILN
ncbi:MAG: MmcQ protein, partial [Oscillospiraceae bacterium]|nr:MmcQ protein [Oscillospiraceae bacterium]